MKTVGSLRLTLTLTPPGDECPLKIHGWKTYFLLKWPLSRGHVSFQGCKICAFSSTYQQASILHAWMIQGCFIGWIFFHTADPKIEIPSLKLTANLPLKMVAKGDDPFPLGPGLFLGAMLVLGRVDETYILHNLGTST